MSNYIFYFDEAYHDRKISISEKGILNTQVPNALDNYVGVFWGEKISESLDHKNCYLYSKKNTRKYTA